MDYTKGPWKVIHEFNVISDTGRIIAACGGHSNNHNVEGTYNENIANTRLISAAPDMYEALKMVGDYLETDAKTFAHDHDDMLQIIYNVIATAEGGQD